MTDDPFGTARIRASVLAAWRASPARFREDANAEEDLVRGGYRDRLVVELAQNAADAAARAAAPGRLLLRLDDDRLTAANTGVPLDPAGVESLSTLRASSKRDHTGSVGRFGVGFAAVLAVTDEPRIASRSGAVHWDAQAARELVEAEPVLSAELHRRGGHVPVLRLPFAGPGPTPLEPPDGYDTVVVLPLRDGAAADLVRRLLADVDEALLLALPALAEVVVETGEGRRVVTAGPGWQVVRAHGSHPQALLAQRPVEERDRPSWSVTWAKPLAGQAIPGTLHAPTPTDEPLELPALLIASFPLDPTRRHVAPGPLTDAMVAHAADCYLELVQQLPAEQRSALVPGPVAAGRLDGAIRDAVLTRLRDTPWLVGVDGRPVAPRDAVAVAGAGPALLGVCASVVAGLVADEAVLGRLGVRRLGLADLADLLSELDRPPAWWHQVYAALDADGVADPEALGALPVPLADGRLVRGPRGVLLPTGSLPGDPAALGVLGLRLAHPEAAHPLLTRLGAEPAHPRTVLERPELRLAVEAAWTEPEPEPLVDAVLTLVAAAGLRPGELAWLAGLPLRDADGELAAADELLLPGSPLAGLADPETIGEVHPELVARWGREVLAAVGVLDRPTVAELVDVVVDPLALPEEPPLPDLAGYLAATAAQLTGPAEAPLLRGIRELDVVADDAWPQLLALVAGDPQLRAALVEPLAVPVAGARRTLPSYTAWWVRTRGRLQGRPPGQWRLPEADDLAGLYDPIDLELPAEVLAAAGVRRGVRPLLAEPDGPALLLQRLADPARVVPEHVLEQVYAALAALPVDRVPAPDRVRVTPERVVDAADTVVVDVPHHLQLPWPQPPLVVPLDLADRLAERLDVATSSDRVTASVSGGRVVPVPAAAAALLPGAPADWREHDELVVDGHHVDWWVGGDGVVHASTLEGLAWGLSWVSGRWPVRWAVLAVLAEPDRLEAVRRELRLG